jgi:hypothetical protein
MINSKTGEKTPMTGIKSFDINYADYIVPSKASANTHEGSLTFDLEWNGLAKGEHLLMISGKVGGKTHLPHGEKPTISWVPVPAGYYKIIDMIPALDNEIVVHPVLQKTTTLGNTIMNLNDCRLARFVGNRPCIPSGG